jgi:hypothetical protein
VLLSFVDSVWENGTLCQKIKEVGPGGLQSNLMVNTTLPNGSTGPSTLKAASSGTTPRMGLGVEHQLASPSAMITSPSAQQ